MATIMHASPDLDVVAYVGLPGTTNEGVLTLEFVQDGERHTFDVDRERLVRLIATDLRRVEEWDHTVRNLDWDGWAQDLVDAERGRS